MPPQAPHSSPSATRPGEGPGPQRWVCIRREGLSGGGKGSVGRAQRYLWKDCHLIQAGVPQGQVPSLGSGFTGSGLARLASGRCSSGSLTHVWDAGPGILEIP